MSVAMIHESEVLRPDTTPLTSSVLDHAEAAGNVVDLPSFGLRNNEGLWPSYNCLDTLVDTPMCPSPLLGESGGFKQFSVATWQPAFQFAYIGAVQCSNLGLDMADQKSEIERVFGLNEGKGIEQALLYTRFVASDSDAPVGWAAPVDVTPSGAVSLQTALALLEGRAAALYAGVPTIHMPRAAGSLLNERIVWKGDLAYTRMGSKVAFGGGYDDAEMLETGEWDLYATGEVYIERSKQVNIQSHVIPGDGSGVGSEENGLSDNTTVALAERMYRAAVDCFVMKVTGTVTGATGEGFGN